MMPEWLFYGVGHDPHLRCYASGMALADRPEWLTDSVVAACVPPVEAPPFEVRITKLVLEAGEVVAMAFREPWKTQLSPDPVPALIITRMMNDADPPSQIMASAGNVFPEVWRRFPKLTIGETCTYTPPSSAPSVSSTSETAPASPPAIPSGKSSA